MFQEIPDFDAEEVISSAAEILPDDLVAELRTRTADIVASSLHYDAPFQGIMFVPAYFKDRILVPSLVNLTGALLAKEAKVSLVFTQTVSGASDIPEWYDRRGHQYVWASHRVSLTTMHPDDSAEFQHAMSVPLLRSLGVMRPLTPRQAASVSTVASPFSALVDTVLLIRFETDADGGLSWTVF